MTGYHVCGQIFFLSFFAALRTFFLCVLKRSVSIVPTKNINKQGSLKLEVEPII